MVWCPLLTSDLILGWDSIAHNKVINVRPIFSRTIIVQEALVKLEDQSRSTRNVFSVSLFLCTVGETLPTLACHPLSLSIF